MQPTSKFRTGIRFGIMTALLYIVLLFIRYRFFSSNPLAFVGAGGITFIAVLVMYLLAGIARKKELNGYATFRDILQTIFVCILITELAFVVFNGIYLKYVDPAFWENFKGGARAFFEKAGMSDADVDKQMKMLDEQGSQMTVPVLVRNFGMYVIVDSIVGMIYASILRKKKNVFPETDL